jgi:hypothetical protein
LVLEVNSTGVKTLADQFGDHARSIATVQANNDDGAFRVHRVLPSRDQSLHLLGTDLQKVLARQPETLLGVGYGDDVRVRAGKRRDPQDERIGGARYVDASYVRLCLGGSWSVRSVVQVLVQMVEAFVH